MTAAAAAAAAQLLNLRIGSTRWCRHLVLGGRRHARQLPTIAAAAVTKTALVDALCNIELASRVMDGKKGPANPSTRRTRR